ncbi:3-isopropylmalate dehydrogenase [uncultured Vagococcus sp.]|uniref:3-isopropylmalate dehydrogenase n=1 Tax=uncultured Vagococcus sp. TaxID=189676 RepID=UPI0028D77EEC|nr:3-isopropylmalate dehydrogenase [uncultured Vagococcus sp.]
MKKIVCLPGDGIGQEIMSSALEVMKVIAAKHQLELVTEEHDFGGAAIDSQGHPLPETTLTACQGADAILLGAIGGPKWEEAAVRPEQGLLALRKALNLYANIRPVTVPMATAHLSPLKPEIVTGADFVVVRELTGGIYFGEPRELNQEDALDTCTYTGDEIRRILRKGFEIAQGRRKLVTSVDKANVLATSKLWRRLADEVATEFPDVTLEHHLVDSVAMKLIQEPTHFDVIVTENLFGDILSDEASVIPGTLGILPSASHGVGGLSLYEPIHGSAPDIAGKNIANPVSMILSMAMMLRESFAWEEAATEVEETCYAVMADGVLTGDLGGKNSTSEFVAAVIKKIQAV